MERLSKNLNISKSLSIKRMTLYTLFCLCIIGTIFAEVYSEKYLKTEAISANIEIAKSIGDSFLQEERRIDDLLHYGVMGAYANLKGVPIPKTKEDWNEINISFSPLVFSIHNRSGKLLSSSQKKPVLSEDFPWNTKTYYHRCNSLNNRKGSEIERLSHPFIRYDAILKDADGFLWRYRTLTYWFKSNNVFITGYIKNNFMQKLLHSHTSTFANVKSIRITNRKGFVLASNNLVGENMPRHSPEDESKPSAIIDNKLIYVTLPFSEIKKICRSEAIDNGAFNGFEKKNEEFFYVLDITFEVSPLRMKINILRILFSFIIALLLLSIAGTQIYINTEKTIIRQLQEEVAKSVMEVLSSSGNQESQNSQKIRQLFKSITDKY